eukprot:9478994-Pyramimonas_sp.AAC.1
MVEEISELKAALGIMQAAVPKPVVSKSCERKVDPRILLVRPPALVTKQSVLAAIGPLMADSDLEAGSW